MLLCEKLQMWKLLMKIVWHKMMPFNSLICWWVYLFPMHRGRLNECRSLILLYTAAEDDTMRKWCCGIKVALMDFEWFLKYTNQKSDSRKCTIAAVVNSCRCGIFQKCSFLCLFLFLMLGLFWWDGVFDFISHFMQLTVQKWEKNNHC